MLKHFKLQEFACPCCGQNSMDGEFIQTLDAVREDLGVALHVNSGFRCVKHNKEVGGKDESYHLKGRAVDISVMNMTARKRFEFIKAIVGRFTGVGIAKTFVHMDDRDLPALWIY